ncbi:30S ribosomal protein S15 [Candidatus Micrarchaeota archaeon]|nr:30S ribosomal protein S15 [Candidatus Micrarchaeota archaeon]
MARMHSKKRGKSGSKRPAAKIVPEWAESGKEEVEQEIIRMGKSGTSSADIGRILRDKHGVPSVKSLLGKSLTEILKNGGVKIEYPEDLLNLIKKAVLMRKHLAKNTRDTHNRVKLLHVESKIRRLAKYYRGAKALPKNWAYDPEKASLLVK